MHLFVAERGDSGNSAFDGEMAATMGPFNCFCHFIAIYFNTLQSYQ